MPGFRRSGNRRKPAAAALYFRRRACEQRRDECFSPKTRNNSTLCDPELAEVLDGRPPTLEDLPRPALTRAVFDETQRLYPPAWGIPRLAVEADEICGYKIEKGKMVVVSQYIAHRHPRYWENPDAFEPSGFLPENSRERPLFAYFPFGDGARANASAITSR